jgi:acyl-CoA synthetase (AMP-forming)/AMP-acid ligase II
MQNDTPYTLPRVLAYAAHAFGDAPAVVDGDVRLSFAALQQEVWRAAAGFMAAGVAGSDRVAVWAPNSWQWIVACLGAQTLGAVVVPLNTRLKGLEAAYILNRSRSCMLVAQGNFLDIDQPALLNGLALPHLRKVVLIDRDWDDFIAAGRDTGAAEGSGMAVTSTQASDILFTSGTTGQPKGVVATHEQTIRVFRVWADRVGLRAGDRYLIVNPFFHTFGYKAGWLACLLTGATAYPMATLDVTAAAALVARERITVLPGPPTVFISLLQHPVLRKDRWQSLASLRVAVTGAATVAPNLIARMRDELGIDTVLTGYGLTESCGVATMSEVGDDTETIARSCGRAIPGVELRIAGASGRGTAVGETGEVLVRGYNVMAGYFDDDEATRQAIDKDGWLHTGDIGCVDERGYLRITDRLKDMYISGGFNCYSAEIERLLAGHPQVAQVAVIGVPDLRLGEVGAAFVVAKTDATIEPEDIQAWARSIMANYKVPRFVRLVAELPTNASGKVLKTKLREVLGPRPENPTEP